MNKFDFNIGATVHCKNGKFGKLQKLVVDPKSMEITDLVVGKGFIRTEERIVPVSDVDCATDEYVMLSINDTKWKIIQSILNIYRIAPLRSGQNRSRRQSTQLMSLIHMFLARLVNIAQSFTAKWFTPMFILSMRWLGAAPRSTTRTRKLVALIICWWMRDQGN